MQILINTLPTNHFLRMDSWVCIVVARQHTPARILYLDVANPKPRKQKRR